MKWLAVVAAVAIAVVLVVFALRSRPEPVVVTPPPVSIDASVRTSFDAAVVHRADGSVAPVTPDAHDEDEHATRIEDHLASDEHEEVVRLCQHRLPKEAEAREHCVIAACAIRDVDSARRWLTQLPSGSMAPMRCQRDYGVSL